MQDPRANASPGSNGTKGRQGKVFSAPVPGQTEASVHTATRRQSGPAVPLGLGLKGMPTARAHVSRRLDLYSMPEGGSETTTVLSPPLLMKGDGGQETGPPTLPLKSLHFYHPEQGEILF